MALFRLIFFLLEIVSGCDKLRKGNLRLQFVGGGMLWVRFLLLGLLGSVSACGESSGGIDRSKTQLRSDGLVYAINTTTPLTGTVVSFHENGQQASQTPYKDGVKSGQWALWFPNGQRRFSGEFSNGDLRGKEQFWLVTGENELPTELVHEDAERGAVDFISQPWLTYDRRTGETLSGRWILKFTKTGYSSDSVFIMGEKVRETVRFPQEEEGSYAELTFSSGVLVKLNIVGRSGESSLDDPSVNFEGPVISYGLDGRKIIEMYFSSGRIMKRALYYEDSSLAYTEMHSYLPDGRVSEIRYIDGTEELQKWSNLYEGRNLVRRIVAFADGKYSSTYEYEYDAVGSLKGATVYNEEGEIEAVKEMTSRGVVVHEDGDRTECWTEDDRYDRQCLVF